MGDDLQAGETLDPKVEPQRRSTRPLLRLFRLPAWTKALNKEIAIPVSIAIASGVATPLILDAIRGTETIQNGIEWTGRPEFSDSLRVDKGAGSTQNTIWRRRCRHVTFAEPFKRPPKILVALQLIDAGYDGIDVARLPAEGQPWAPEKAFGAELSPKDTVSLIGHRSIRVGANASNAQSTGFDLCVFTWSNTRLHSVDVAWLAVPGEKEQ